MGSLSHKVMLHVGKEKLGFKGEQSEEGAEWFCQEAWTPRTEDGRGVHESKIWDHSGLHVASTLQEGFIRPGPLGNESLGLMYAPMLKRAGFKL